LRGCTYVSNTINIENFGGTITVKPNLNQTYGDGRISLEIDRNSFNNDYGLQNIYSTSAFMQWAAGTGIGEGEVGV
jgi:hypothetical protein